MFYVLKCLNNIQIVYNGSSCGLNLVLRVPHFGLPIFQHNICALLPGYSQWFMDVEEMFLNFSLHPELRPHGGVDISDIKIRPDKEGWDQDMTRVWERWEKNFMGLTKYPYRSLLFIINAKFIVYREINDPIKLFQCRNAKMNIPGDKSFTPKLPWLMKVGSDGYLGSCLFIYVDYGCIIAHLYLVYWQAAKRVFSICNSLGI